MLLDTPSKAGHGVTESMDTDPITLELFRNALSSVAMDDRPTNSISKAQVECLRSLSQLPHHKFSCRLLHPQHMA